MLEALSNFQKIENISFEIPSLSIDIDWDHSSENWLNLYLEYVFIIFIINNIFIKYFIKFNYLIHI